MFISISYEVCGFSAGDYEDHGLVGCDVSKLFYPDEENSMFLQNMGFSLLNCRAHIAQDCNLCM
jgi:hypothetical protein